jgi:hypothetical protein
MYLYTLQLQLKEKYKMAYDRVTDKLDSISWNLKRIADSLEQLCEDPVKKTPKQPRRITAREFFKQDGYGKKMDELLSKVNKNV